MQAQPCGALSTHARCLRLQLLPPQGRVLQLKRVGPPGGSGAASKGGLLRHWQRHEPQRLRAAAGGEGAAVGVSSTAFLCEIQSIADDISSYVPCA